ncbi:MAG TPA: sulfite exporter TauE/SafE family protein [Candidatus Eremiobacteraceae bacterium]|nr:sulfite exporter TauE/SafE family protein [Candidatus Eremiobacteraceae bacterium]
MLHADDLALFVASTIGQALNAVAGGGSFVTFPALLLAGVSPIEANATSTVALWPGALASAYGYRRDLAADRRVIVLLAVTSVIGGLFGALLLLRTPEARFAALVPYLLAFATLLFLAGTLFEPAAPPDANRSPSRLFAVGAIQFTVAVYGGYFGGGIGIMMLAAFALMQLGNINAMNGLKSIMGAAVNGAAVVTFALTRLVVWRHALIMVLGSVLGGYLTARFARRLPPQVIRWLVIAVGALLTVYFFGHPAGSA